MSISFRAKLCLIVGTAVLALLSVLVASSLIGARQTADLANVESHLIPRLERGPLLETRFERLTRSYRRAVASKDANALEDAERERAELFDSMRGAESALDPRAVAAFHDALADYSDFADQLAQRALTGEVDDVLLKDMAHMQTRKDRAHALLQRAVHLRPNEISAAFSAVRDASLRAHRIRLAVGLTSFGLLVLLSGWMSRSLLNAVHELRQGFLRFSSGDFGWRIPVRGSDELAGIAHEANQMADNLRRFNAERERESWLKAAQLGLSEALQGQADSQALPARALDFIAHELGAVAGAFYVRDTDARFRAIAHCGHASDAPFGVDEDALERALSEKQLLQSELPAHTQRESAQPGANLVLLPLTGEGGAAGVVALQLGRECSPDEREFLLSIRATLSTSLSAAESRTALEAQQRKLTQKNIELEEARLSLQQKADELSKVSSYKSRFLANVSHELRTPLNSMLLLSEHLAKNEAGNLSARQVEHAKTVHAAGEDLLGLINQILDLSKIEARHQELELEAVPLAHFVAHARRVFEPLAAEKKLSLDFELADALPTTILTDRKRVERILVNLLGNAIKFTDRGKVGLRIARPSPSARAHAGLDLSETISFSVSDTGRGVPEAARERIFAPFEQVESDTHRRYPGTGLGLALARESARLLGGDLFVESNVGVGSTFTCYLPERSSDALQGASLRERASPSRQADAPAVATSPAHLLIAEGDPAFAEQLLEIVRERGFKAVIARSGEEALSLARALSPQGMLLDVRLPDVDGARVLEQLREDPATRDLPVYFMSARETDDPGAVLGAVGHLLKPATYDKLVDAVRALTRRAPDDAARVLVVEDDADEGEAIVLSLRRGDIDARQVHSAEAALEALAHDRYACMILDLGLPDMDGLDLLDKLTENTAIHPPRVIAHTGRALTRAEKSRLDAYAEAVVTKDDSSVTRLLEQIRRFVDELPNNATGEALLPSQQGKPEFSLQGAKLLLAEDDMRTVYAISALLQASGAKVLIADSGREALDVLSKNPDVNGVLMDVMMPEMDGYEAIRRLRRDARFERLPVVALTARSMKGERERCLQAGASDYLAKPVDSQDLLNTMGALLSNSRAHGT